MLSPAMRTIAILFVFAVSAPSMAGGFVSEEGYPPEALAHHWEGRVGFTVAIDPSGHASNCRITSSSGHSVLDEATCRNILARGRFKPAVDAHGDPIQADYSASVDWKIP
ncbi:energy transducer TonB [Sphingomonas oryzagri]|uniref:Energy transducer TonB n=1 Tax=Sphingomonas oryzagri TaxID=3042314 RepID=A0ABT6N087_9SPHN|nr:energy transducer TonB [Sphingomonas oryzagri]MDH7638462.1 energy transducer TonB [Sphingomonas oryzagri]